MMVPVKAIVRFQGPAGFDHTYTLGSDGTYCIVDPAAGDWTITISHPCFTTQTITWTVVQCYSHTENVILASRWLNWDYSDDFGSCAVATTPSTDPGISLGCFMRSSYTYWSDHACYQNYACYPYGIRDIGDKTALVYVDISIYLYYDVTSDLVQIQVRRTLLMVLWTAHLLQ